MKRVTHVFFASLLMVSTSQLVAAPQTMIVLDASGSMWGQINGKPKLQIAREALATVLQGVPQDMELGLIAYGHREKGSCSDIELVVAPAPGTGSAIASAAEKMKFLGKTPLTASVRKAAETLGYTEDKATVILITDGLENCNADPCALGAELAQKGLDFTAHVVGFDLTDAEGKQVACLAENTGGQYVAAANADELVSALLNTVITPEPKAVETKEEPLVLPEATLDPDESTAIGADIAVRWTGPNAENDYIDLVPLDYVKTHGELSYSYTKTGMPLELRAPAKPGEYQVRYIWRGTDNKRHILATATVQITDSEVALLAPDSVQAGGMVPVSWKGPDGEKDYIDLVPADHERTSGELSYAYTKKGPELELVAPTKVGNYQLRYILSAGDGKRVLTTIPLLVTKAEATISVPENVEAASMLSVFWTGPAGKNDYVDLVPADHERIGGEIAYFRPKESKDGESGELRAPSKAGDYVVRYILRGAGAASVIASQPLVVTAAEASLSLVEQAQAGSVISVAWTGPASKNDYIDLVPADHERIGGEITYFRPKDQEDGRAGKLTTPSKAGDYLVRYILKGSDSGRVIASQPLVVTAAEASLSLVEQAQAGSVISVAWTGPAGKDDYIDLVLADHERIGGEITYFRPKDQEDGRPGKLTTPSKAGDYLVRYILKGSGNGRVIATQPLVVTAAEASLSFAEQAQAGSVISVAWTGPAGKDDYIDLVLADHERIGGEITYFRPKDQEDGRAGKIKAPSKAGNYAVRYILKGSGNGRVIASELLMVTAAEASLSLPAQVQKGDVISVDWTGPAGKDDYIDLVPAGHERIGGEIAYFRPKDQEDGRAGKLKTPEKAGDYLVRYVLRGSGAGNVIASQPIKVTE